MNLDSPDEHEDVVILRWRRGADELFGLRKYSRIRLLIVLPEFSLSLVGLDVDVVDPFAVLSR